MYDLHPQSLASFTHSPLQEKMMLANYPLDRLIERIPLYNKSINTEEAVLQFYFYNHALHLIKTKFSLYEVLPDDLYNLCQRQETLINMICQRMLYQVFHATLGHFFPLSSDQKIKDHVVSQYGQEVYDYFQQKKWTHHQNLGAWTPSGLPKSVTCGQFCGALLFYFGMAAKSQGWAVAWADIARLPYEYVYGHMSLETMADQAISICHNGGSILNKGGFFSICKNQMYEILDVQHSGQVPQWILSSHSVSSTLKQDAETLKKYFPEINIPVNNSLIKSSADKRLAYQQKIAQKAAAIGNNKNAGVQNIPPVNPKVEKQKKADQIILGNLFKPNI